MNILTFLVIIFHAAETLRDNRVITTLKYSRFQVKPTVVHGTPVDKGEVPYLVSIKEQSYKIDNINYKWLNLCGGSIIAANKVLSAAHCFEGNNFYYAKRYDLLGVAAGSLFTDLAHDGSAVTTEAGQWRKLSGVSIHRHFFFPLNDIALVYTFPDWKFTRNIKSISLAKADVDYPSDCFIAGYGRLGYELSSAKSSVLLRANINLYTRVQCNIIWEMKMNSYICTNSAVGDVSRGDSGGPLVCHRTSEEPDAPLLVGIVSGKNFDKTTLFTRVSAYRSWIDNAENSGVGRPGAEAILLFIIALLIYLVF